MSPSNLDLADLHTQQMNTLRRLRLAYDESMKALRAAAPADREQRKEMEHHLADAINLLQGCVYMVNHEISNAEARERAAAVASGGATELLRKLDACLEIAWQARTLPASVVPAELVQAVKRHLAGTKELP